MIWIKSIYLSISIYNLKSGRNSLDSVLFIAKNKSQFKQVFCKGGRNFSWSPTRVVETRASTVLCHIYG